MSELLLINPSALVGLPTLRILAQKVLDKHLNADTFRR